MMTQNTVYIFSGSFKNIHEASLYSVPQWQPEPDESVSDEEYLEWEERNPTHKLQDHIDSSLDEDFIETVKVDYSYLDCLSISNECQAKIKRVTKNDTFWVLVFENALSDFKLKQKPTSNSVLHYCGEYTCGL